MSQYQPQYCYLWCWLVSSDPGPRAPPPSSHLLYSAFRLCYENPACRGSTQKQTPPPPTDFWTAGATNTFYIICLNYNQGDCDLLRSQKMIAIFNLASQVSSDRCNLQYCLAGQWTGRQYNEWDLCPKCNGLKRLITFTSDLSLKLVVELLAAVKHNR